MERARKEAKMVPELSGARFEKQANLEKREPKAAPVGA
jgi:hypothetical protein